jgi:hypothetical protein
MPVHQQDWFFVRALIRYFDPGSEADFRVGIEGNPAGAEPLSSQFGPRGLFRTEE